MFDWVPVSTNIAPVNGLMQIGDTGVFPRRYYRAVKAQ